MVAFLTVLEMEAVVVVELALLLLVMLMNSWGGFCAASQHRYGRLRSCRDYVRTFGVA